jgi:hypothetical protein
MTLIQSSKAPADDLSWIIMLPLRPVPAAAPRPQPLSSEVTTRALAPVLDVVGAWFQAKCPTVDADRQAFCLKLALQQSQMQAFRAATILTASFHIPCDDDLLQILLKVIKNADFALRLVTREWVVATGYRFPAKDGDLIEWIDPAYGSKRGGTVIAIDQAMAIAMIAPGMGGAAGPIRIFAEDVVGNLTQKQYTEIKPILGQRYEDAPALAAAYEREHVQAPIEPPAAPVKRAFEPMLLTKVPNASMLQQVPCPQCDGLQAQIFEGDFCMICQGHGYLPDLTTF